MKGQKGIWSLVASSIASYPPEWWVAKPHCAPVAVLQTASARKGKLRLGGRHGTPKGAEASARHARAGRDGCTGGELMSPSRREARKGGA